ncbi:MAG: response regulator [Planctomycetota bacterium]
MRHKSVFTTGEAAKICRLSQQTIIRCFDSGQLEGFRVPGSKFRRIPRPSLIEFMQANHIPMEGFGDERIKVLIVDDDPEIIELFADALAGDGRFEIGTAGSGYDAGVMTQQMLPDAVVLDYMLPDIDGHAVCRTIRQHPELSHIKIICISGLASESDVKKLLDAGANDFVRKPFNVSDLVARIIELVGA